VSSGVESLTTIDDLVDLYESAEAEILYDEVVTEREHGEQCAVAARAAGASTALIAAALLHDVGHLVLRDNQPLGVELERDHHHDRAGALLLTRWFGPEVTDPVRLHVVAKRYLCTTEAGYAECLSPSSVRSLDVQGGLMTSAEVDDFESNPHASSATALRRWDDAGKVDGLVVEPVASYRVLLHALSENPASQKPASQKPASQRPASGRPESRNRHS